MAYRNMVCTPQVIDLESDRGHVQVHPESVLYGGSGSDLSNQDAQLAVGVVGNATNMGLSDLRSYYDSSMNHQHQHVQNSHPHLVVDSGLVFPSNMYNPSMSTTSVNRYFGSGNPMPLPLNHQVVAGHMDESGRNGNVGESARGFIKRKNAVVAGSYHFVNGFASSSSSSSHVPQNPAHRLWDASFESNVLPNVSAFNPPEYHGHGSWPSLEGSSRNGTNGFNSMAVHPESVQHGNYILPTSHMGHCFQPASNAWIAQAANGITDGVPQWEYINAMTNIPGRFAHAGAIEMVNGGLQEYQNGPSAICRGPLPYFHQHPVQSIQSHNLLDHTQLQVPYQQCLNTSVAHGSANPSSNGLYLGPRIPAFLSNSERTFGAPRHPLPANPVNHGTVRILPPEHATVMDLSRFYEVANVIDEHRDMRLDIDSMTYEELLALEEQIGDVNTGLAKGYIQENLRTSLYVPGTSFMLDQLSESSAENDACIICQEEYEVKECVGTLDCGHKFHAECIKQWLIVKNLCPICKTTALSANRRNG